MVLCNKCVFVGKKCILDFMLITASLLFFFLMLCSSVVRLPLASAAHMGGTSICLCFYTSDVHLIFLESDRTVLKP